MSPFEKPFYSSLTSMLGRSAYSAEELEELRRKAWVECGLLIIHPWDRRLSEKEGEFVRKIAERAYGGDR